MLEGETLLAKVRIFADRPMDQIARICGYVGPSGRLLKQKFYYALVLAKGFQVPGKEESGTSGAKRRGRQADFTTRVHGNGNLLIGQTYTHRAGIEPGQEFFIEIHEDTGSIFLLPCDGQDLHV
ncbi:MAG: transcriptional regulator [Synechococcus sp. SB0668_bin_15]|nr:transcriptional regulator [Synechococcus sp. SB0668_bin_15]MXZ82879.1 transcriptional regulator [Synechococcus sp. SB0666_bin_14]MYA91199.1 transcriptional regulator [Synechococcus sp. SB0663_bin_10]MYC49348.1 transcriptional regulator [Synechococcus sp. SB0662_bin_14]MYG45950.1 transcriptional regulator [Synechococcus sp. SB0675_bin_6]MYJ59643.1 transcriptional regulator [Synechococcus sp. SB0672_bin_6]MYK92271.1 transcriptional regulator [Synechococcus sp. SB0669_bin_8]